MKRRSVILAFVLAMGIFTASAMADELQEASPSTVAGYYHSDESDFLLLANGTSYLLTNDSDSVLEGPTPYIVYIDGDDFVVSGDRSYILFNCQKEKGKTESGGSYYAMYSEYLGVEREIGFKEGRQVSFQGLVFENDYSVCERNSLASFFGVEYEDNYKRMEGDGFDSPEDALKEYIIGLQNNDIDQMISAFAVETYAENYDLEKMVERCNSYRVVGEYIPAISDFSLRLNIEERRAEIRKMIRGHYLVLQGSPLVLGENVGMPIFIKDNYGSAKDLLNDTFLNDDTRVMRTIVFDNDFLNPAELHESYSSAKIVEIMQGKAEALGGEEITSVAAKFYCDGRAFLLAADAIKYNGRWYLQATHGTICNLLGTSTYQEGLLPLGINEDIALQELMIQGLNE